MKISKFKLTKSQWDRLSEILGNLGLVGVTSLVIPYWLGQLDTIFVICGLVITIGSWYTSLVYARKY